MSNREDVLNREEFENNVINLIENLSNDKKGCMFAIDGKWGIGKSFVLEDIEEELESIQCEETNSDKYLVFHYNCWQYDYYEEPAVAIVSAMLDKANENVSAKVGQVSLSIWKKTKRSLNSVAREMVKNKVGIDLVQVANDVANGISTENRSKYSFDKLFAFKKTLDDTKKKMSEIAQDRTIVIVVDELDRCIPNYAIKVLERLHHFFEGIDNVIVVFAIDSNQLNHSIEEMFGQGTDTEKYLKKFMSFKLKLEYGEPQQNIWDKYSYFFDMYEDKFFSGKDIELTKEIVVELFKHTKIDIREKEKIIEKINTIHRLVSLEKQDYSVMLFELMVCFFIAEQQRFNKIIGKSSNEKMENLEFLANIKSEGFIDKRIIDGQYIEVLQRIVKKSEYRYIENILIDNVLLICKNVISLSFFYLKELYLNGESEYDKSEIEKYNDELVFCRKFDEYRKLIQ